MSVGTIELSAWAYNSQFIITCISSHMSVSKFLYVYTGPLQLRRLRLRTKMEGSLIGICLVGEALHSGKHVIGAVHVQTTPKSINLRDFRSTVTCTLPSSVSKKHFLYLTSQGWEINESLEHIVKLSDIIGSDDLIKIRIKYDKPRIGIVIEGEPDVPVGFIFCEFDTTIRQVHTEIKTQLPSLYDSLKMVPFAFLDRNGWPISREQERLLTILEISSSHTIRIRCARQTGKTAFEPVELPDGQVYSRSNSTPSNALVPSTDPLRTLVFSPINETAEKIEMTNLEQSWNTEYNSIKQSNLRNAYSCEILLSYVHKEASPIAILLKESLESLGYSVFLDVHCIQGGIDWQDALNEAISNCTLFVPLITMLYGQTLWTNREVKLADVLGKVIIPVNFIASWPPKCLAIQFATTQYITGCTTSVEVAAEGLEDGDFTEEKASSVAVDIIQHYKKAFQSGSEGESVKRESISQGVDEVDSPEEEKQLNLLKRQDTQCLDGSPIPTPVSVHPPASFLSPTLTNPIRKMSTLRSYASTLPKSLPSQYREAITAAREGKPLVVISCSSAQKEFAQGLVTELQAKDYEVWCSCDIDPSLDDEMKSTMFQNHVDEAGVVVFILSKDFEASTFCEQQVYYCEQRKRIIPLLYDPGMKLPNWMAPLIGTNTFINCQGRTYKAVFMERIEAALNPKKVQDELKKVLKQKAELAKLCLKLSKELPKGKHVYLSGGTKFYSPSGEAIGKELGKQLAQDLEIILITGGFYGVGETVGRSFYEERMRMSQPHGVCHVIAVRDDQDKSNQTRQNPDGTFQAVPYGDTIFLGDSVRQREMLTPRVIDLCVLIEGGPGAAFEAQQFNWNGHHVIPVKVTGGAAGGLFNLPETILKKPPNVSEFDWHLLGSTKASPTSIAAAIVCIIKTLKDPKTPVSRSRSGTGNTTGSMKMKRSKVLIRRGETMPEQRSFSVQLNPTDMTLQAVKRALSTQDPGIVKRNATNM